MPRDRVAVDDRDAPIARDAAEIALSRLAAAVAALDMARDGKEMGDRLAREAARSTQASGAYVFVRGKSGAFVVVADAKGGDDLYLDADEARAMGAWFDAGGRTRALCGEEVVAAATGGGRLFGGASAVAFAPLRDGRRVVGAAAVFRRPPDVRPFAPADLYLLDLLTRLSGRFAASRDRNRALRRDRKRLEASMERLSALHSELMRSERARTTADLVSGVAHELNNPLTAIIGYSQMLARRLTEKEDAGAEWASEIAREAERCGETVRRLSAFASRRASDSERTSPRLAVDDVLALKAYDLRAACVRVENLVHPATPDAAADRSAVQHVLLNLVNNAIDAVRDVKKRVVRIEARADASTIELRVTDTGPGVPEAVRDRVFEPLFTSKIGTSATGLGLTACREILTAWGGTVALVDGADGAGAAFVVKLPRAPERRSD